MSNRQVAQLSPTQQVALGLLKGVNMVYDVITLPLYTALQAPWKHWQDSRQIFARPIIPENPHSPWARKQPCSLGKLENIQTMDQLFRVAIEEYPDHPAMGTREVFGEEEETQSDGKVFKKLILGDYKWITFKEMNEKIELVGRGLMSLGIRPRENIVILADTRQEWMLTAQACLRLNIPVVTLYATLGEEGILHGINETEAQFLVTSQDLLDKLSKLAGRMPCLRTVIYMESPAMKVKPHSIENIKMHPFSQLEMLGNSADKNLKGETPTADDIAIIMYTSGSTGVPKGVMISQGNIVATTKGFYTIVPFV
ncbi:long chain fatty acid CoA ligase-like, partial [Tropilaelaps mercedesae]